MLRRNFLKAAAALPVAPIAAKMAREGEAMRVGGLKSVAGDFVGYDTANAIQGTAGNAAEHYARVASALGDKKIRAELTSLLFEQYRQVSGIDPDIAVYRSFSLNAKIAFQRQRNVERRLAEMTSENAWSKANSLINKAMGLFK